MHYQSLQEIFDTAVRGLASQGFTRSMNNIGGGSCAYRGAGGKRCALGWCIPDELYASETEGATPSNVNFARAYGSLFNELDTMRLTELQEAHDLAEDAEDMRRRLRQFARDYKLTIPAILQEPSK